MRTRARIDDPHGHAHAIARGADRAFEQIAGGERCGQAGRRIVTRGAPRILPRHDAQTGEACQSGGDIVRQPVGKRICVT